MVVLKVIFLLSKNLIDPSVVKVSPYYFLYGKYLFFCVVLFYFYIYFATERRFMELKQNNMTSNYLSEEYLMNTVARFWKKFVAEEFSYGNVVTAAPGNVAVAIPASGKRNYKDLVFRKIFHDKEKLLSLYNALNHSHYEDPELLHITTLENAVYLSLQNDLSFVVDFDLWFFEHQSTLNPNMPYRFLLYLASEYSKLNTDDLLYSNKLQMLDTPHFVVFYNGTDPLPEYSTLKLSSFEMRLDVSEAKEGDSYDGMKIDATGIGAMRLQIGANEGQVLEVNIPAVTLQNMGIEDIDVNTQDGAKDAISRVDGAIKYVSSVRGRLGAFQNRLESSINSLDVTSENMTAAYSRIMDVDMAEEMTSYTTYQILAQAGTSMLAQANERPSQVLQLLQ